MDFVERVDEIFYLMPTIICYTMYQATKIGRRLVRSGSLSSESSDSEEEVGGRMRSIIVQVRKRFCVRVHMCNLSAASRGT